MYRYNCVVRLAESANNEVGLFNVSAAEITILRKLHGRPSIIKIVELANDKSSHEEEREKLFTKYVGQTERRSRINFEELFGPEYNDLPARLRDFAKAEKEEEEKKDPNKIGFNKQPGKASAKDIDPDDIAG